MVPTLIFLDFHLLFNKYSFHYTGQQPVVPGVILRYRMVPRKTRVSPASGLWAVFVIGLQVSKSRSRILKPGVSQSRKVLNLQCYTPIPQFNLLKLSLARSRLRFYLAFPVLVAFISFISREFKITAEITTVVIIKPKILSASAM